MITDTDPVIKVSFFYKPKGDETVDDVRSVICSTFDPFNLYNLDVRKTTMKDESQC